MSWDSFAKSFGAKGKPKSVVRSDWGTRIAFRKGGAINILKPYAKDRRLLRRGKMSKSIFSAKWGF